MEAKQIIEIIVKSFLYTLLILFAINLCVFMFRLAEIIHSGVEVISFEFSNFQFMLNDQPGHNQFTNQYLIINVLIFLTVAAIVSRNDYSNNGQTVK